MASDGEEDSSEHNRAMWSYAVKVRKKREKNFRENTEKG